MKDFGFNEIKITDDFKTWMKKQSSSSNQYIEGAKVESKLSYKKLLSKIYPEEGETDILAKEFALKGGTIKEENGENFLVKVQSGEFFILKSHVELF